MSTAHYFSYLLHADITKHCTGYFTKFSYIMSAVDCIWNVMAHMQKSYFVFPR